MVRDWLDLGKTEKALNKSLSFDMFDEPKRKRKGTLDTARHGASKSQKTKPVLTKHQQTEAKKFIKETGSAFGNIIKNIKNRKIRKLEKETLKNKEKSEALAHKIKTLQANKDYLNDIARYEKELEQLEKEDGK